MDKHTNPFHAFAEAISIFAGLGENPMLSGATYTKAKPTWPEEALGISVSRRYANGGHYYVVEVHLLEKGFNELVRNLGREEVLTVARESHSGEFDMLSIEFNSLLKIFCLVPKSSDSGVVL